jgi:hypothetical protein
MLHGMLVYLRPLLTLAGVAGFAVGMLWPYTAAASASSHPTLAPETARELFVAHGYAVGELQAWSDGVSAFAVSDGAHDRAGWPTLRVLVFADAASATAYREARPDFSSAEVAVDRGPRLLAGYGGSAWRGNLAMMQVTDDPAAFQAEPECVPDPVFSSLQPQPRLVAPSTGVEARFLNLLSS